MPAKSSSFRDAKILLGVTGGIAAYKSAALTSQLRREGAVVQVVMTEHATKFVTPLTFLSLSRRPVRVGMFEPREEADIEHIALADWPDLVVVAPCTANLMGKITAGIADDLLSTILLATTAPVLLAPAMNVHMWEHPATQRNLATLVEWGYHTVGPEEGDLACGYTGKGRMSEPEEILARIRQLLKKGKRG
ncbi:bifunctional phosphopantothenoylcysteine decarboxylase/phosphopantothenate--cysteine ligase CoaBC [bacterium]|nr:bifunctional phosphopantothenoylcysteine decarboxylase/phosphopantothenate--cysteine ligase CoaBC [bacterium]